MQPPQNRRPRKFQPKPERKSWDLVLIIRHEQTGTLISGRLRFNVDGEIFDAELGDSWCLPGGVEHAAEALEDSVVIEVFSPVREDYLP